MASNNDINIKINVDAKNAEPELNKTSEALDESAKSADKASGGFTRFGSSIAGTLLSTIAVTFNLVKLAQSYLGLTIRLETTSSKLKVFDFLVQNTHKDISISLGFLKRFADFLRAINFPITPLTRFVDLMGSFRVVIGIGKGEKTLFEHIEDGIKKASVAAKNFQLNDFRQEVKQAALSLALFAVQAAATFKSLKEGIAREASFSQASRTINGTREEIQGLKAEIEKLSATELAVPVEDLYAVAGIAGAMGKSVAEIPEFIRIVSEGAVALDIPAQQLAESLGTIQTQLDLTQEGLVSLSDQVNTVADSMPGKVREIDVFEVLSTGVATAGKNFGLLKGETVALVGSLLSLGEVPETARTAIVNLLSSLQNAKNQTDPFQEGLRLMGTSAEKLAADIKAKPLPTLQSLLEKMNGLSKADRLDLATKFLGKGQDAIALAKLVDNVDLFKASLKSATDETVYSGSVHAAYVKQIKTVDAKLTLLKNSFNNLTESLTTTFLPAISKVVDGFRWLSNGLTSFSENHPIFKTLAAVTLSILSVAGALRFLKLGINALGLLFGFSAQGGILAASLRGVRLAILGIAGAWATFQTAGIGAVFTAIRAGSVFVALRALLIGLFGGTIGLAIGALTLLFVGISNLLPVTVKWGETTTTVGQAIKAMLDIIVQSFISSAAAVAEFLGLSNDFAELKAVIEGVKKAFSGEWLGFGGVMADFEAFVNAFIHGWQLIGARTGQMADKIGINIDFIKDVYNAMFDDSTVEDAQKKRQAALLRNEQIFTDEMARIMENNPMANFKSDVERRIKAGQQQRKIAKPDQRTPDTGGNLPSGQEDPAEAKKRADLITQIQKEQRDRDIQNLRDAEARKIYELQNSGKTQKQIDDAVFAEKIRTAQLVFNELKKQLAQEKTALTDHASKKKVLNQEEIATKKATLKEIQDAYKTNITALSALEKEHRDKVVALDKEIKDLKKQGQDGVREIARAGMTDAQLSADKQLEIERKTAQLRQLMQQDKPDYSQAAELGKELNALTLEQGKAAAAAAKAGGDYRDVTIAQYNYEQSLKLTNEALTKQKSEEQAKADKAAFDAEVQRQAYTNLATQIEALNTTLTTGSELKVIVDTTQVDVLKQKVEEATKPRVIEISWSDKNGAPTPPQHKNKGGFIESIKRFASGGHVPGAGNSDTVPAMLTPGEFVIQKPAVQRLNPQFLHALNSGKLNPQTATKSLGSYDLNLGMGEINLPTSVSAQNQDVLKTLISQLQQQKRTHR